MFELIQTLCLSFRIPDLEGKPNLTALDIQQKTLRDRALENIMKGAKHLFEEATDINKCLSSHWRLAGQLKQLGEEVCFYPVQDWSYN